MPMALSALTPVPCYTKCLNHKGVMSSINDALRKAQQEKDLQALRYGGILARSREGKTFLGTRLVWRSCFMVVLIFLAIAGLSWLDFGEERIPERQEAPAPPLLPRPRQGPSPVDAPSLYDRAREHHRLGHVQDAKRLYLELLKQDPGHVEALNNLGVIYMETGDLSSARGAFEKAIRLRPGFVEPFYNLACLHAARGEINNSLSYLKRAISLNPEAREWARMDRDLEGLRGLREFEKTIKMAPKDQV